MTREVLRERLSRAHVVGFDAAIAPPPPVGRYAAVRVVAGVAYVSGQMPKTAGGNLLTARDLRTSAEPGTSPHLAYASARLAMANALAQAAACDGVLEVRGLVRITGYFVGLSGEALAPALDGASDLAAEVFGRGEGAHARVVLGCAALPMGAGVELAVEIEVRAAEPVAANADQR